MPVTRLIFGVATVGFGLIIVSFEIPTAEFWMPDFMAMALIVAVTLMANGPEYNLVKLLLGDRVGVFPLVVYQITVPVVEEEIVTICKPLYVPVGGLIIGVAAIPGLVIMR